MHVCVPNISLYPLCTFPILTVLHLADSPVLIKHRTVASFTLWVYVSLLETDFKQLEISLVNSNQTQFYVLPWLQSGRRVISLTVIMIE